ncbi:Hypothetical predicted protein [Pelobates cultripes]|uniref:Uncharacterized protein n=1 Tax=Pelobates cultripes TaxID=61616 RepID=A0AAD1SZ08_PELCU|nr:Hypothetical predicted protein [Pelobates cultripes]
MWTGENCFQVQKCQIVSPPKFEMSLFEWARYRIKKITVRGTPVIRQDGSRSPQHHQLQKTAARHTVLEAHKAPPVPVTAPPNQSHRKTEDQRVGQRFKVAVC